MTRFALLAFALVACATDPVTEDPTVALTDDVTGDVGGGALENPAATRHVRDLRMTCATRLDGVDELRASVTSDFGVAFAFVQLRAGELHDGFELDFQLPELVDLGGIVVPSKTSLVSSGKLEISDATPITCASLGDFGAHVTVAFDDGAVECAVAGNAAETSHFRCR